MQKQSKVKLKNKKIKFFFEKKKIEKHIWGVNRSKCIQNV